jgi:DNA-binding NarL/FixJ family response regulator
LLTVMQPLLSPEFGRLVQRCSCAPCAALRSAVGAPVVRVPKRGELQDQREGISPLETRVLGLLALGLTNAQIGDRLGMTEQSVKRQLRVLFRKVGVTDRTAAALRAQELGLVDALEEGWLQAGLDVSGHAVTLLSADEQRTLALVSRGLSNHDIARTLNLAESTVKNRLGVVFRKLGVRDRTQAALAAVRLGLIRVESQSPPRQRRLQAAPQALSAVRR